jgi:hypothetical protein
MAIEYLLIFGPLFASYITSAGIMIILMARDSFYSNSTKNSR